MCIRVENNDFYELLNVRWCRSLTSCRLPAHSFYKYLSDLWKLFSVNNVICYKNMERKNASPCISFYLLKWSVSIMWTNIRGYDPNNRETCIACIQTLSMGNYLQKLPFYYILDFYYHIYCFIQPYSTKTRFFFNNFLTNEDNI